MSTTVSMPMQRGFALLTTLALVLAALVPFVAPATTRAASSELFFSEYIEGSSNNKALEIYNGTGATIDLAAEAYSVQMYFNGGSTVGLTINLTGSVANGDVYVLAQSTAERRDPGDRPTRRTAAGWFNGDDAVVLRHGTTVLDVIGQIGFDPGTEWGTGLTSTADNTLRRKVAIAAGDTNGADAFDPSVEWDGYATNTFSGLGSHSTTQGDAAPVVSVTSPASGATGVTVDANIDITFSEPVNVSGAWFSIGCTKRGAHRGRIRRPEHLLARPGRQLRERGHLHGHRGRRQRERPGRRGSSGRDGRGSRFLLQCRHILCAGNPPDPRRPGIRHQHSDLRDHGDGPGCRGR